MGMYDFLGKTQVKLFTDPVVLHPDSIGVVKEPITELKYWPMTGNLKTYNVFNKVPYRTMYYDYGKNFMVFDPRGLIDAGRVYIIMYGRYIGSIHYSMMANDMYNITTVVDTKGEALNVKRASDFGVMLKDFEVQAVKESFYCEKFWEKHEDAVGEERSNLFLQLTSEVEKIHKEVTDKWYKSNNEIHEGWEVGGFLCGIYPICSTDSDVANYVNLFLDKIGRKNIDQVSEAYCWWCSKHDIPVFFDNLVEFLSTNPTIRNLEKLISVDLWAGESLSQIAHRKFTEILKNLPK